MKRLIVLTIAVLFQTCLLASLYAESNVAYSKQWVHGVSAQVVTVNLNSLDVRVSPALAKYGVGSSEGFGSMISRLAPTAAITGTYFCVRSLIPVGDIVINGESVHSGCVGTAVCFTENNVVEFKDIGSKEHNWTGYMSVICTGSRLVRNGSAYVTPRAEGFKDPSVMHKAQRCAIGVTKNNKVLLVTVKKPVYLSHLAHIMRELGAMNAVCLDGGSSSALYFKGRSYCHPGRRLTNLLVIYESPEQFANAKSKLAPEPLVAAGTSRS